jgi:hypothetical protein
MVLTLVGENCYIILNFLAVILDEILLLLLLLRLSFPLWFIKLLTKSIGYSDKLDRVNWFFSHVAIKGKLRYFWTKISWLKVHSTEKVLRLCFDGDSIRTII